MQRSFVFSCFLFISLAFSSPSFSDTITYSALTDSTAVDTEWKRETKEGKVSIVGNSHVKTIAIECTPSYELKMFSQKEAGGGKEFSIQRNKNSLQVSTVTNGKKKTKKHDVGQTPWIQDFKFGFPPFLSSEQTEYKFYIVNPRDLGLYGMVATKEKMDTIKIQGKLCQTQKVKITLQGFRKKFWKAELWFDPESHLLLRYKANEGPGTPFTVTTLSTPLESAKKGP